MRRRSRRRPGRRRSRRRSSAGRSPTRTGSRSSPASTTTAGLPTRRSARPRRAGCGTPPRAARAGSRSGSCSACGRAIPTAGSSPSTTRGSTRSGPPPRELDLPVVIHIADPIAFFEPLDATNERWEELARPSRLALLADRDRPDEPDAPGFPPFDELLAAFERLVARHPGTTFVGAHVGCAAEDLGLSARLLDEQPEPRTSTSPRGSASSAASRTRRGRSSFATRTGSCSAWTWHRDPDVYAVHYRFLETFDESFDYGTEPVPGQGRWQIHGIGLPDDVLRKVYRDNARRILRLGPA